MSIICADGLVHSFVDELDEQYIRTVRDEGGHHRSVPLDAVEQVEDAVCLNLTQDELRALL
ncbi:DUF2171 domain-containing protein [Deinococcus betulae]|uniref:DUF2171 domain-containing protein n=1 Tax=Deinococcus betulae TaxID=2873312 RepID=UPI0021067D2F|nr:DUF2171 domain-containing protein [Deinococcus betulae]